MDFLTISGCDTSLYHSQGGATVLYYVHFGMTAIKVFYFITQTATDFRCMILLYCERNNLLFITFLMHSIW